MKDYLFTSERLGFREWKNEDLTEFAKLNANKKVMEHFPKPLTYNETKDFISRLKIHYKKHKYCYFATELKETGNFIGFIGLAYQTYLSSFTPAVDIGWRLKQSAWGSGYATEGAKRCLALAFNTFHLNKVIATCTVDNVNSENVMKKIGMTKKGTFNHPYLKEYPTLQTCNWYAINRDEFLILP